MLTRGIATIAGGVIIAAITLWIVGRGTNPNAILHVDGEPLQEQFADTPLGARVALGLDIDRPFHAYVFTHHIVDGVAAMYPSPWLRTDTHNPIQPGAVQLPGVDNGPGDSNGSTITWPGPSTLGPTDLVLVLSEQPIPELASLAARVRQASNKVFPDGSAAVLTLPEGVAAQDIERTTTWPLPLLANAAAEPIEGGAMRPVQDLNGVWTASWKLVVREAKPLEDQLKESFGPLQKDPTGAGLPGPK